MPGTPFTQHNRRGAKIDQTTADEIRLDYASGMTQGALVRKWSPLIDGGISISQIGRIVRGEVWTGGVTTSVGTRLTPALSPEESLRRMKDIIGLADVVQSTPEPLTARRSEIQKVPVPPHLDLVLDKLRTDIKGAMQGEELLNDLMNQDDQQKGD